ncbi:MAG: hypothetical protein BJ554DRAFT_2910 [Olpidium bornovanus]|uniref:Uncharacterized protein n=1 Tax=Olpidium bornovanus TaxID=278681 RepID=A0A8H7ZPJ2_9FUNG|nr:MAG: hypothetical protein BJ554DRAFT_2910 [Olpidium bornovanus]
MRPAAALLSLVGAAVAAAPAAANPSRLVTPDYWGRVLEIDPALQTRACRDALFRANRETRPACFIPFGFFVTEERVAAYCAGYEPTCSVEINHHVRNLKTVCAFGALPYGAEHRYNRHYVHLEYLIGTFENACQKYEISPGVEGYCSVFKKNYLSEHGLSFTQQDRRGLDDFKNVACHHGCSDVGIG